MTEQHSQSVRPEVRNAAKIRRRNIVISIATGALLLCIVTVLAGRHVASQHGLTEKILYVVSGAGILSLFALVVLIFSLVSVYRLHRD